MTINRNNSSGNVNSNIKISNKNNLIVEGVLEFVNLLVDVTTLHNNRPVLVLIIMLFFDQNYFFGLDSYNRHCEVNCEN